MFDDIIISKKEPIHSPIVHEELPNHTTNHTSSSGTGVITDINIEEGETLSV